MRQVRLYDYLKKLDENHLKQIEKYLNSSFFKVESRNRVIALFEKLRNYHPEYDINDELIAKKLGIANKKQIANLKVNLRKCVENYLRINEVRSNKQLQVLLLANSMDELGLNEPLIKFADDALNKLNLKKVLSANDYYLKHQLLKKLYIANSSFSSDNLYLIKAMETLSYFYLYENLNSLSSYKTLSKVIKKEGNIDLTLNIINSVQDYQTIEDPNISVSYYIYRFHSSEKISDKEKIFEKIKAIIKKDWKLLTSFYKYEVYVFMLNAARLMASKRMNLGYKEIYKIHQFWVSKKVHLTYPELDNNLFISIVKDYCHANKFVKCEKFTNENGTYLAQNRKLNTINFCKAYLKFSTQNYQEALHLLSLVKFKNVILKVNQKIVELKCAYELNDDIIFSAKYKAMLQFINRQKEIEKDWGLIYLKFAQYINKLMQVKLKIDYINVKIIFDNLCELEHNIKTENSIFGRIWLLDSIKKLKELT